VIQILQSRYAELTSSNLKIFHIYNEKNLKGFTTTEVDKKRGTSRFPLPHFRFTDSDLLTEDYSASSKTLNPLGDDHLGYDEGKALRDQQYAATKDYNGNDEEEDPDEEENEVAKSIADFPSQMVFKKHNKAEASLEDFRLLKIVGKGTFGKVYQCQHIPTGKIFAMKCIRKDVVLENDSI
jgi:hypothetical protein